MTNPQTVFGPDLYDAALIVRVSRPSLRRQTGLTPCHASSDLQLQDQIYRPLTDLTRQNTALTMRISAKTRPDNNVC